MHKHLNAALLFMGAVAFQAVPAKVLRVPADFPTITAALTHVDFGDSVIVSPGRYSENVTLVQGVVLSGTDPLKCIIDGARRGPAVYAVTGSEISNFTITNGIDGILCENASPHIHHNWIIDNEGAGIGAFIALPQIDNNIIYGNRWTGILVWGAKSLDTRIENNVLMRNGYSGLSLRGPCRIVIRDNIIMENHEYGIYSDPAAGQSQVVYNDIYHNDVFAFNRYTKANKSNISLDPMFLNSSLGEPNFFSSPKSPVIRRGYEQADIGLMDHAIPAENTAEPAPSAAQSVEKVKPVVSTPVAPNVEEIGAPQDTFVLNGVNFREGSADLTPASYGTLDQLAAQLQKYSDRRFEVSGHTDNTAGEKINMKLSVDQANAVRDYLIRKGLDSKRLLAMGYGSSRPRADNKTADGRALNRRIEFYRIK